MTRIVVHEHLCSGALAGTPEEAELLPMGRQIRDALAADLAALPGLQLSVVECAAAPCTTPGARALHRLPDEGQHALLQRLARTHDHVWVVAPESGDLLIQAQATVGPERWIGCSAEALHLASRKSRTLAALSAQGLCTPFDCALAPGLRAWVVKPDDGAGAVQTWRLESLAAARDLAQARRLAGEAVTLQPWVEGPAMSLSLLCQAGRAELLSINTQQLRLSPEGQVHFEGVTLGDVDPQRPSHQALLRLAQQVAQAIPGLRGFVGVDLVWHPARGPVVIEVNPRVSCAYAGQSARLGRNLAGEILALHAPVAASAEACHAV